MEEIVLESEEETSEFVLTAEVGEFEFTDTTPAAPGGDTFTPTPAAEIEDAFVMGPVEVVADETMLEVAVVVGAEETDWTVWQGYTQPVATHYAVYWGGGLVEITPENAADYEWLTLG